MEFDAGDDGEMIARILAAACVGEDGARTRRHRAAGEYPVDPRTALRSLDTQELVKGAERRFLVVDRAPGVDVRTRSREPFVNRAGTRRQR
jgi:hypothetical protein